MRKGPVSSEWFIGAGEKKKKKSLAFLFLIF